MIYVFLTIIYSSISSQVGHNLSNWPHVGRQVSHTFENIIDISYIWKTFEICFFTIFTVVTPKILGIRAPTVPIENRNLTLCLLLSNKAITNSTIHLICPFFFVNVFNFLYTHFPKPLKEDAWLAECDALNPWLNPNEKDCEAEWLAPGPLALLLMLALSPPLPVGFTLNPPPNPNLGFTWVTPREPPSPGNRVLGSRSRCSRTGSTGGVIIGSSFLSCLRSSGNTKPLAGADFATLAIESTTHQMNFMIELDRHYGRLTIFVVLIGSHEVVRGVGMRPAAQPSENPLR